ncbi:MAG: putative DNA binding domain-containing protein, partial [Bacteroidales bacterium]|nr:putative DNA binding domain-containing protein [Bacteroidales bacterium]
MNGLPDIENQFAEFKTSFNEEVIETLVAFANAKGGKVYVGVNDSRKIAGVTLGKETTQQWLNEIKNKTEPFLLADAEIVEYEGKNIVVLSIAEYPIKPIAVKGRCYKRVGNSNHLLSISEAVNLHLQTLNTSWDAYPTPNHTESDISMEKILSAMEIIRKNDISLGDNPMTFLQKYNLIRDGKITNAAYLLFKKDDSYETAIELGRFQTEIIIKDMTRTKSDIITQVGQVFDFVKKHISKELIFKGEPMTTERWQYPLEALREIIVNMIIHRDYRSTADSIVKIFNDKIEFWNPGLLPENISIEDLYNNTYRSNPRNKIVADVFKDMKWIEKVGTGYKRILDYFKAENLNPPKFETQSGGVLVTVYSAFTVDDAVTLSENSEANQTAESSEKKRKKFGENGKSSEKTTGTTTKTAETAKESSEKKRKKFGENGKSSEKTGAIAKSSEKSSEKILKAIENNTYITIQELSESTKISTRAVEKTLAKLKALGILERIGADKGGYWKIN